MEQDDQVSIQFKLLGRFEVWREGQLLEAKAWPQRKTQSLLKILLSERGQVFTQDQLVDALFPNLDLDKAADNLHKRVSELRHVLEPELQESGGVQLYPAHGSRLLLQQGSTLLAGHRRVPKAVPAWGGVESNRTLVAGAGQL